MRVPYYLAIVSAFFAVSSAYAADSIPHWQVLADKSAIEWTATYGGKPVKGTLPDFEADMVFDPAHLETSKVMVKFAMAKVKTDDKNAQENLPTADWFAASDFPVAIFEATSFKYIGSDKIGIGAYVADGTLTIRGKTVKISLPFSVKFYDDKDVAPPTHYALVIGDTTLKRTDFGVGQGDWAKTDAVADDVKVVVHIEAKQVP